MALKVADLLVVIRGEHGGALASIGLVDRGIAGLGLAAAGATALLVKMGIDAQTQLSIVAGLTGATADQMKFYTTQLEGLGAQLGYTLDQSAKGLYYVVSAGFQGRDAITVLHEAMLHAAASGSDLKATTDGLTSAMNAYAAKANQASYYSDIFTTAVTYGKQTTEDFANNVSKAALMAAGAHVPFIQLAAAEADLTEKGETSARAFTELSFLMSKISVPSAKQMGDAVAALGGHLDETKYSSADLMGKLLILKNQTGLTTDEFLKLIGGTRSARGALGLLADGGVAYTNILKKMQDSSGSTAAAFQVHTQTMQYAFDKVKAAVSNAGYELVKMATPTVIDFLRHVADAAGNLPDLFKKTGDGVAWLTAQLKAMNPVAVGVALGVVTASVAALAVAVWSVVGGVLAAIAPFAAIAAAVALVATGVIWAYQNWSWFRTAIDKARDGVVFMWGKLGDLLGVLGNFNDWLSRTRSALMDRAAPALNNVSQEVGKLHNWLNTQLIPTLRQLYNWFNANILPILKDWGSVIGSIVMPKLRDMWSFINAVLLPILHTLAGWLKNGVGAEFKGLGADIHNASVVIGDMIGNVKSLISWLSNLRDKVLSVRGAIGSGFGAGLSSLHIPGFARGGTAPGGPIVAGEDGPELLVPPTGTQIIDADTTAAILGSHSNSSGGSGGYRTANIYVMLDRDVLARQLQQPLVDGIRAATGMRI